MRKKCWQWGIHRRARWFFGDGGGRWRWRTGRESARPFAASRGGDLCARVPDGRAEGIDEHVEVRFVHVDMRRHAQALQLADATVLDVNRERFPQCTLDAQGVDAFDRKEAHGAERFRVERRVKA